MPQQVGSGSNAAAGVAASASDAAGSTERQTGTDIVRMSQCLGGLLNKLMTKLSKSGTGQAVVVPQPMGCPVSDELAGNSQNIFLNPVYNDSLLTCLSIDLQRPLSESKKLYLERAIDSLDRLEAIKSKLIGSPDGAINLTFIEQYCGLRNLANEISPNFIPRCYEGQTAILAPHDEFTIGVIHHEIQLIDSILNDIRQNDGLQTVAQETRTALKQVRRQLNDGVNLMSTISRKALFFDQANNPSAMLNAANECLDAVKQLPHGDKLLLPLTFYSKRAVDGLSKGHAIYMVVEKNSNDTVNLHMVNRGLGSEGHRAKPGEVVVDAQEPKTESAVSKWNVQIEKPGGLDFHFFVTTLMLTLDARTASDGWCVEQSFHADPKQQLSHNISQFYCAFSSLSDTGPPARYEPIYQRPQKDGNCAYSNLKASMRYLLGDQSIYNLIDLLKTDKVTRLTLEYMKQMVEELIRDPDPETAVLKRYCYNAVAAVDILLAKYQKVVQRVKDDKAKKEEKGVTEPSNSPPHLQHLTN